jgi:hypothetical protein
VDDFGALNSALADPEPILAEAVSGAALEPPPETVEGAPDAPQLLRPAETRPQRPPKARLMPPQPLPRGLKILRRWRRRRQRRRRWRLP